MGMNRLLWIALATAAAGIIGLLVGVATWPRPDTFTPQDPTASILWLTVGGTLLSLGVLAGLLHLHAVAVGDQMRAALNADRAEARRQADALTRRTA
jgi:hypothetical protein